MPNTRDLLGSCLGTSVAVKIHGMSMNAKTWRALLPKKTSADNNIYYGGFNADEFDVWLDHHPAIFTEHEDEFALLTGKVPLLLSVFARVYNEHDSWEYIVQRVQQDAIVKDWKKLLTKFYEDIDGDQVWKVYALSVDCDVQPNIVDFRFFYEDSELGLCATNEIVLRLLYQVWSKKSAGDALLTRWRDLLPRTLLTVNRSALGFTVEEIIKAQICLQGVVEKKPVPNNWPIKRTRFAPGAEALKLEQVIKTRGTNSWWILLDPVIFNYAGVDMILVTGTELAGINVTIAKTHSSLDPFFNLWRELAESNNLAIKGLFLPQITLSWSRKILT
ncbi:hypothetical protein PHYPSEUDO_012935 [Phytophthora pseudosyringae]|uniref:Uncharacterized protein n=1 Tax=Phytophthora pseudosyringae TaxID=221518 RepID=A0A8T1V9A1_9STRA|nr:hypothetical protein PHYPSEUDO_012935 [Phytophthora pseudosyringae]